MIDWNEELKRSPTPKTDEEKEFDYWLDEYRKAFGEGYPLGYTDCLIPLTSDGIIQDIRTRIQNNNPWVVKKWNGNSTIVL